ncbi:hypothetical protein J2853_000019 [Streptosporangium lutulentum]|uniref:Uncharacterized protein n=1 Tax=Streptosporangium lutulentum TaxID=1461250 RepID=A0ABT9Q245_9ACTN|nr:hypothetical protein [Streptosporangium lutulentum]
MAVLSAVAGDDPATAERVGLRNERQSLRNATEPTVPTPS